MSAYLYAVRCNFTGGAAREALWHDWYNGPKAAQMLRLPMFLSLQRFLAVGLDRRRKYLALWQVEAPEAFATPEYRAQWGFAEWTDEVTDWSRDLFRAPDDIDARLEIGAGDALHCISFDGLDEDAARAARARIESAIPDAAWLEAIGLDKRSPVMALQRVLRDAPTRPVALDGATDTIFAPLGRKMWRAT